MLSINMRVFKTVLLFTFFGASVRCLPVTDKPTESKTESKIQSEITAEVTSIIPQDTAAPTLATPTFSDAVDYYDQRQNGTENYRVQLDGLVFVFAPVEALLLAGAAASNLEPNLSISSQNISIPLAIQSIGELNKPVINSAPNKTDLAISKTLNKPAVRLVNFLAPLIRRIRHVRGTSVH